MSINLYEYFSDVIIDRAYTYYMMDRIVELENNNNNFLAKVIGNDIYKVNVILDKSNLITDMTCNCPYAKNGYNCKHMAAVIFKIHYDIMNILSSKINEINLKENDELKLDEKENILNILNDINQEELKKILLEILASNDGIYKKFESRYINKYKGDKYINYKRKIDDIFVYQETELEDDEYDTWNSYLGGYNNNDYYVEYSEKFVENIKIVLNSINELIEEDIFLTLNIIKYLVSKFYQNDSVGSDVVYEKIALILHTTLNKCENDKKVKVLKELIEIIDICDNSSLLLELVEVFTISFLEIEYSKIKLDYLENRILISINEYGIEENLDLFVWVRAKINIYYQLNYSNEMIIEEYKKYLANFNIGMELIKYCKNQENYLDAITNLKILRNKAKKFYNKKIATFNLVDLYEKSNNIHKTKEELKSILFTYDIGNIESYKKLKSMHSKEDWKIESGNIIYIIKGKNHIKALDLYVYEKMYKDLFDSITQIDDIEILIKYEIYLKKLYPIEILNIYEKKVLKMATFTDGRNHYKRMANLISRMGKYPNGNEKIKQLVDTLIGKYSRRRAMKEELLKVLK
ncbi:SWIM zinc finger family protein [Helicovermis profundi]|uniref:SWIM-type domain-containing protein n=1 Tax=Helicovermis profundi TaxID=3065157 RepID=A0AAU9EKT9_9FIRM|nr:hypothetical protein HLPR_01770 [Clostridia bacterium S502]